MLSQGTLHCKVETLKTLSYGNIPTKFGENPFMCFRAILYTPSQWFRNHTGFLRYKPPSILCGMFPGAGVWGGVCWRLDGPSGCRMRILLHSAAGSELSPHYLQHKTHYSLSLSTLAEVLSVAFTMCFRIAIILQHKMLLNVSYHYINTIYIKIKTKPLHH